MKIQISILVMLAFVAGCLPKSTHRFYSTAGIVANGNAYESIQTEIDSDVFIDVLAQETGRFKWTIMRYLPLAVCENNGWIDYSGRVPSDVMELTLHYIRMRHAGHSQTYALTRLQAKNDSQSIDQDQQAIIKKDNDVNLLWLKPYASKHDTDAKYTYYVIVDGELAWSYVISRRKDNSSLIACNFDWFDSKEFLPEYKNAFLEVEREVEKMMKSQGNWDQFGSIHGYWGLKQEFLKKRGIEWRSPSDLHPNNSYD